MTQPVILNKDFILREKGYKEEEIAQLEKLDLANQNISSIEPDTFSDFHNLKELHLNNNLLSHLHSDVFKPLNNLETLYLNHNELTEIDPYMFKGLKNLKHIHIFSNKFASETIEFYVDPNVQVFKFENGLTVNRTDDLPNTDVVRKVLRLFSKNLIFQFFTQHV